MQLENIQKIAVFTGSLIAVITLAVIAPADYNAGMVTLAYFEVIAIFILILNATFLYYQNKTYMASFIIITILVLLISFAILENRSSPIMVCSHPNYYNIFVRL